MSELLNQFVILVVIVMWLTCTGCACFLAININEMYELSEKIKASIITGFLFGVSLTILILKGIGGLNLPQW